MKKILYLIIFLMIIMRCNDDKSSSSDEITFKIQPDSLSKFTLSDMSYNITFDGVKEGEFAIIYNNTVNGTSYVGIAVSDDPSDQNFNMKIYFEASSIPDSKELNSGGDVIKVAYGNSIYTYDSGDLTLAFNTQDDINYSISSSGSAVLSDSLSNSITLSDISITAPLRN